MTDNLNSQQYTTNHAAPERPGETGSRIAVLRLSSRLSSGETIRLDSQPHQKFLPHGNPHSYVTRALEELVDERPVREVMLKKLRASDTLTIQTENSTYTFLIIDPVEKAGILTGGKLKQHMIGVILVGALDEKDLGPGPTKDESRLRTGAQAVFYLKSAECIRRITTSRITHILHGRGPR